MVSSIKPCCDIFARGMAVERRSYDVADGPVKSLGSRLIFEWIFSSFEYIHIALSLPQLS